MPEAWRETVIRVLHQRLAGHEHPEAVADALRAVPRSAAFAGWDELRELALPTVVVPSRDDADPGHPYAVGERYAETIPGAELVSEQPGESPLAWQGSQLSRVIADLAARVSDAEAVTGYSGTPLPRKLGIKPGHRLLLLGAPDGFELAPLPDGVRIGGARRARRT